MLSSKYIRAIARMNDQYGPPEDTFSPRWHAENPGPGPDAAPVLRNIDETGQGIIVQIRHVILASGDRTITNDPDYVLPEGASFAD